MRVSMTGPTLMALLALAACGKAAEGTGTTESTESGETATGEEATDTAVQAPPTSVGQALSPGGEVLALADLVSDPAAHEGETVRVQGTVVHRCGSGCSLTLADGDARFKIRADASAFQFPEGWADRLVVAEGIVRKDAGCKAHHEGADHSGQDEPAEGHADAAGADVTYTLAAVGAALVQG